MFQKVGAPGGHVGSYTEEMIRQNSFEILNIHETFLQFSLNNILHNNILSPFSQYIAWGTFADQFIQVFSRPGDR